jgi:hypothetical protein
MAETSGDSELQAIQTILSTLGELDSPARSRVIDYVFRRLGLAASDSAIALGEVGNISTPEPIEAGGLLPPPEARDIRSLKATKDPKSAVEMSAIVAYYLAELAPPSERKDAVSTSDLTKYFKQAGYPLPKAPRVTLANAASAGYFDSVARGKYKLNPVGYNLVVHGLPGGTRRRSTRESAGSLKKRSSATKSRQKKRTTRKSK